MANEITTVKIDLQPSVDQAIRDVKYALAAELHTLAYAIEAELRGE